MNTNKTIIFLVCSLLLTHFSPLRINAQDHSSQALYIIYIDHEVSTPVKQLSSYLQAQYDRCDQTGNAMIVYLSNGEKSLISLTNLKDPSNLGRDKLEALNHIITALQNSNYHSVNALIDRSNILKLFEDFHITNDLGEIQFRSVSLDFHIGPDFWQLHHNEKIIAPLYMAIDVENMPKNKFSFNVLRPQGVTLDYPEGQPFGITNLGNINNILSIKEFVAD